MLAKYCDTYFFLLDSRNYNTGLEILNRNTIQKRKTRKNEKKNDSILRFIKRRLKRK